MFTQNLGNLNTSSLIHINSLDSVETGKAGGNNIRQNSQSGGKGWRYTPSNPVEAEEECSGAKSRIENQSPFNSGLGGEYLSMLERQSRNKVALNKRIEVKPDWLQFIGEIDAGELFPLLELISMATRQEVIWHPNKRFQLSDGISFKHTAVSPNGLRFAWNDPGELGNEECAVVIPGKVLSALSVKEIHDLSSVISSTKLRCTRIDIAMDDYGKRVSPVLVMEALSRKNYARFQSRSFASKMLGDWTFYLGSRQSARFTRFYNKDAQTKGKIPAHRWETSFKRDIAQKVFKQWTAIKDYQASTQLSWERRSALYMVKSVIGSFNFIDRESRPKEKNLNRIPRLDWWQKFIDELESGEGIYHTRKLPKPTLERATNWMKRQVMRSLCCIMGALEKDGLDWFRARIEEARLSLQVKHMVLINQYKFEYQAYKGEVNFSGG